MHGPHDGRFAPSPTGELHLGNLRTALAAWLFARSQGGRFLLRVDDLDPDRSRPEHERQQVADLQRIGLDWDGDIVHQSARLPRYRDMLRVLEDDGHLYPCFCTRAEVLSAASAPHEAGIEAAYPGTCAALSTHDAQRRVANGDPHCLRIRANSERVAFEDMLRGRVEAVVDDFIVRRRDGVPAYNLASPLDEADLQIDEVVRGADLATTTPRQIWLAELLQVPVPRFAHLPLVVGDDGSRLAKRNGATSLRELEARGVGHVQVVSLLAVSLGIELPVDEPCTPRQLVDRFEVSLIPSTEARLDLVGGKADSPELGSGRGPNAPL